MASWLLKGHSGHKRNTFKPPFLMVDQSRSELVAGIKPRLQPGFAHVSFMPMSKVIVSSLYDSDVFRMACRQFDKAADAINLPDAIRDRTKYPRRCLAVALPVKRKDGSVTVFEGYRVQHNLSTGP